MNFYRIIGLAGLVPFALCSASCHKSASEGAASEGAVISVTDWPSDKLDENQLTSAAALQKKLLEIEGEAPPIDYSNSSSSENHDAFIKKQTTEIIGTGDNLLEVKCGASTEDTDYLSYTPQDKNLHLNLYTRQKNQESVAQDVIKMLRTFKQVSLEGRLAMLKGESSSGEMTQDLDDAFSALQSEAAELGNNMEEVQLSEGPKINVSNSPVSGLSLSIDLFGVQTHVELANAMFASHVIGGEPITADTSLDKVTDMITFWEQFPPSANEFWTRSLPYGGDAKDVCLIIRTSKSELMRTKDGRVLINAHVAGWYLVRKPSLAIIAQARVP